MIPYGNLDMPCEYCEDGAVVGYIGLTLGKIPCPACQGTQVQEAPVTTFKVVGNSRSLANAKSGLQKLGYPYLSVKLEEEPSIATTEDTTIPFYFRAAVTEAGDAKKDTWITLAKYEVRVVEVETIQISVLLQSMKRIVRYDENGIPIYR